jgi:predicted GNAT family acetyltransferase
MPSETIDYILMSLNRAPNAAVYLAGPQALELRHGRPQDIETLFPLQAAYEKEEVLPFGMDLTLSSCHYHLMEMLKNQTVMSAWLGGEPVGKINTSGSAFNYTQIGGVYVAPGYRRMGIAGRLTTALSSELITSGKTVTLFVKKNNKTACGIYLRSGFEHCGNYRICYYD